MGMTVMLLKFFAAHHMMNIIQMNPHPTAPN
jgi:hypothetical protein